MNVLLKLLVVWVLMFMAGTANGAQVSPPVQAAIEKTIQAYYRAVTAEDLPALLSLMHFDDALARNTAALTFQAVFAATNTQLRRLDIQSITLSPDSTSAFARIEADATISSDQDPQGIGGTRPYVLIMVADKQTWKVRQVLTPAQFTLLRQKGLLQAQVSPPAPAPSAAIPAAPPLDQIKTGQAGAMVYHHPETGVSLPVPAGWVRDDTAGHEMLKAMGFSLAAAFRSPDREAVLEICLSQDRYPDVKAWADYFETGLLGRIPFMGQVLNSQDFLPGTRQEAVKRQYTGASKGNALWAAALFVYHRDRAFVLIGHTRQSLKPTQGQAMIRALEEVELSPAAEAPAPPAPAPEPARKPSPVRDPMAGYAWLNLSGTRLWIRKPDPWVDHVDARTTDLLLQMTDARKNGMVEIYVTDTPGMAPAEAADAVEARLMGKVDYMQQRISSQNETQYGTPGIWRVYSGTTGGLSLGTMVFYTTDNGKSCVVIGVYVDSMKSALYPVIRNAVSSFHIDTP